jgi:hypothetical protein
MQDKGFLHAKCTRRVSAGADCRDRMQRHPEDGRTVASRREARVSDASRNQSQALFPALRTRGLETLALRGGGALKA